MQNSSNKYYIMENLTTYKSNKKFLEERYNLIASGTNKKVYYNGNNNIVFKLFENPNILEAEIIRYQILIENNINFFTPKLKIVNKFVCVSQFAAPIKLKDNHRVAYNYNIAIMDPQLVFLKTDPIKNTMWKNVCNETVDSKGLTPIYNWGIRNNKILLLDIETILHNKVVDFFKDSQIIDKFKEVMRADQYYG